MLKFVTLTVELCHYMLPQHNYPTRYFPVKNSLKISEMSFIKLIQSEVTNKYVDERHY